MRDDDLARFSLELITVADGFYDKKNLAAEVVLIYFNALRDYDLDSVIQALGEHVRTPGRCNFFPKPGSLIELIEGTKAAAAMRAWSKVDKAIRSYGRNRSVVFDDPVIHAVVDEMGGWLKLCETGSERDLEFAKNNFCKRYEALGRPTDYPAVLLGALDLDAIKFGRPTRQPVCVGNVRLAMEVLRVGQVRAEGQAVLLAAPVGSVSTGRAATGQAVCGRSST